jgi:hypothetical protein
MHSQTFILRLRLPHSLTREEAVELLGAADCTETLVGIGEPRHLALMFAGPVELEEIGTVARAIPHAMVLSFVSGSEGRT